MTADRTNPVGQSSSIPTPTGGIGSTKLQTDTNDPVKLRELLEQARERLAFYEGFEGIMAESTRRNGELMVEAISLRDDARQQLTNAQEERTALDALATELTSLRAGLDGLDATFNDVRLKFDVLNRNLQATESSFSAAHAASAATELPADQVQAPTVEQEAPAGIIELAPEPLVENEPEPEPRATAKVDETTPTTPEPTNGTVSMDVVVDGVNRAATALSLQRYLRELDVVSVVVAKEFAGGILRLKVDANRPLNGSDLSSWQEGEHLQVREARPTILDLVLPN